MAGGRSDILRRCCHLRSFIPGIALIVLWVAIAINALDVKAAEEVLKYLTYIKIGAIGGATIIGFVYIAKSHPGTAAYENLHNSFANSSLS